MRMFQQRGRRRVGQPARRGAVTVELAVVVPVLVTIVLGMVESSRIFEIQNLMSLASREGARLAAMDRDGLLLEGQTTNAKIEADVKVYLESLGFNSDDLVVAIVHADSDTPIDLDDPANSLKLFAIRVEIPYSKLCETPPPGVETFKLSAGITFRNGRVSG